MARHGRSARRPGKAFAAEWRLSGLQRYAIAMWFIVICDPQWFLASFGAQPIVRVPLILISILIAVVLTRPDATKGDWLLPIAIFIGIAVVNLPFSYDRGESTGPLKSLILYYLVGLAILRTFRTPRSTTAIVFLLFVGQYLWFGLWGLKGARVEWHPDLANFDAFGPLMATGVGPTYFYATGAATTRGKRLGYLAAALCILGVINSFARGAVLALCVTVAYIWWRSPRKGQITAFLAAGFVIVVITASMVNGKTRGGGDTRANFWSEMSTMFDDSEGSTGDDRKVIWRAATREYLEHPILGVGIAQFGPVAASEFQIGDVGGAYAENPATLYGKALHSIYFQILSEFGTVGAITFVVMLAQFWMRCRVLFQPAAAERWRRAGGQGDLRSLALGLESGMVAFLASGAFFNQLSTVWFYGLLTTCSLLYYLVVPAKNAVLRPTRVSVAPAR
jgi:O-antigen ligase